MAQTQEKPSLQTQAEAAARGVPTLNLSFTTFATGLVQPVEMRFSGISGDDRLFVVEQLGRIRIVSGAGVVSPTPFLDIDARVTGGNPGGDERGLLGLAFHPDYANNGLFYVQYTYESPSFCTRTRISQFSVTGDANVADPNSEDIVLEVGQPANNHNAGGLHFGPNDGFLYIPMGDGGGAGDNAGLGNNAQNPGRLLGKIIRIDVDMNATALPDCTNVALTSPSCSIADNDANNNYRIPADNPFLADGGTCDEIWASGLRNPFRSGFDTATGDFFLGDVGQFDYEEIDYQPAASTGGENYGWRCYEGDQNPFNTTGCGPVGTYEPPIFEIDRSVNTNDCTIIGGRVYRGSMYPEMVGTYISADYCSGNIYALQPNGVGGWDSQQVNGLTGFGTAAISDSPNGEIYFLNVSTGRILHLEEDTVAQPDVAFANGFEGL